MRISRIFIGCSLLTLSACQSQITGNEGNLVFSYTADDRIGDFNKPIAIGAKLDVRVRESGTNAPVELTQAFTEDQGVLAVETFTSNQLTLSGVSAGTTLVEVEAQVASGDTVTDSVNMRAAEAVSMELWHSCADKSVRNVHYVSNTRKAFVYYNLFSERDEPVIGYGLFPLEVTPAELATLDTSAKNQAAFLLDLSEPGEVTLSSTLDETTLNLTVVAPGSIDGAELAPGFENTSIFVNQNAFVLVMPTVNGERVCQASLPLTVRSLTEDICDATSPGDYEDSELLNESNFVRIDGKAQGTCEFEVTFADGALGQGATSILSVSIGEI